MPATKKQKQTQQQQQQELRPKKFTKKFSEIDESNMLGSPGSKLSKEKKLRPRQDNQSDASSKKSKRAKQTKSDAKSKTTEEAMPRVSVKKRKRITVEKAEEHPVVVFRRTQRIRRLRRSINKDNEDAVVDNTLGGGDSCVTSMPMDEASGAKQDSQVAVQEVQDEGVTTEVRSRRSLGGSSKRRKSQSALKKALNEKAIEALRRLGATLPDTTGEISFAYAGRSLNPALSVLMSSKFSDKSYCNVECEIFDMKFREFDVTAEDRAKLAFLRNHYGKYVLFGDARGAVVAALEGEGDLQDPPVYAIDDNPDIPTIGPIPLSQFLGKCEEDNGQYDE